MDSSVDFFSLFDGLFVAEIADDESINNLVTQYLFHAPL